MAQFKGDCSPTNKAINRKKKKEREKIIDILSDSAF